METLREGIAQIMIASWIFGFITLGCLAYVGAKLRRAEKIIRAIAEHHGIKLV